MIRFKHYALLALALGSTVFHNANAVVVDSKIYQVGDSKLCFFPNGYIGENGEAHLYGIENNDEGLFGKYFTKTASFFGPDIFSSSTTPLSQNMVIPKFIFAEGEYLPVNAIKGAFNSSTLNEVCLQDNIMRIEALSFHNASNLQTITLPVSLTFLGDRALAGMENLGKVFFRSPLPPACEISTPQLQEILNIGTDISNLPYRFETPFGSNETIGSSDFIENIEFQIPKGSYAFYFAHPLFNKFSLSLKEYQPEMIPVVNRISDAGFSFANIGNFCVEVRDLVTTGNKTEIPAEVYSDTFDMGIDMRENSYSVKGIGYKFLANVDNIDEIIIPDGVEYILEEAFKGCSAKTITIGRDVRFIGFNAFSEMRNLESVFWELPDEGPVVYPESLFTDVPETATLFIDKESSLIDLRTAPFNRFKNIEQIQNGVDDIRLNAYSENISAIGGEGEVIIKNFSDKPLPVTITDLSGVILFRGNVQQGEQIINVPSGFCILRSGEYNVKLIVK